ncbi:MAG: 2-succinyl-5-enolpyruvyl-6-hydroxy-3-cyclohexene-1-carboxylic-acid synthase [Planctomycetota bacterium]|nr:MAG: 2-succinyl-5-enolpyruvyl-6-hydroxy-3-cyclohexene-1-carboxylic-acid synthase [Planctomycetota bacterium]
MGRDRAQAGNRRRGPRGERGVEAMKTAARNLAFAERLVAALVRGGVREAVLSPGSRNTPLVLAVLARPELRAHSVLDERVAGFFGLGLARASGRPVALLCTSGSAGAHYYPAVLEAEATSTRLLAVTADRPPELHGCGAPQTLDQRRLYGPHAAFAHLGPADDLPAQVALERSVASLLAHPGPAQLNVAFREPLWEPGLRAQARSLPGIARREPQPAAPAPAELGELARGLAGRRGAILCGPDTDPPRPPGIATGDPAPLAPPLLRLAQTLGWPLLCDAASGLRHGAAAEEALSAYDLYLRRPELARRLRPDVVLRFGRVPTSKAAQRWLDTAGELLLVDPQGAWHHPGRAPASHVVATPRALCESLLAALPAAAAAPAQWRAAWRAAERGARAAARAATEDGLWEGAVARTVAEALPAGTLLHAASSLTIRDLDAYAPPRPDGPRIVASRGLNGIDGTLATAFGEALAWPGPTCVLLGDLAFLHDAGALLAARALGVEATVVVVDNGGGGIFDLLPIAAHPTAFARWFRTPQRADLASLCAAAGVPCLRADDLGSLRKALRTPEGLRVVWLPVDPTDSLARRRAAEGAALRAALSRAPQEEPCPSTGSP